MGKVKISYLKNMARKLIETHGDKFSEDFAKNKEVLEQILDIKSKKVKNVLAGYIVRQMKIIKRSGV